MNKWVTYNEHDELVRAMNQIGELEAEIEKRNELLRSSFPFAPYDLKDRIAALDIIEFEPVQTG